MSCSKSQMHKYAGNQIHFFMMAENNCRYIYLLMMMSFYKWSFDSHSFATFQQKKKKTKTRYRKKTRRRVNKNSIFYEMCLHIWYDCNVCHSFFARWWWCNVTIPSHNYIRTHRKEGRVRGKKKMKSETNFKKYSWWDRSGNDSSTIDDFISGLAHEWVVDCDDCWSWLDVIVRCI